MTNEQLTLIEDCEQRESRLSEWDIGFIDSIRNQIENGKTLTKTQAEKLDEIWERVTARG